MDIDLKQLLQILAISQTGSFGRAATQLRMSQPALSNSIAQLERKLGKGKVFERGRHGAKITDLGSILLRHAEALQTQLVRISEEIDLHKKSARGPLNIGVTPVAAASLVPIAIASLKVEFPSLAISVIETSYHDAVSAMQKGALDVLVGPIGVYPPVEGIDEEALATDPFAVIVRSRHVLANRRSLSLKKLRNVQWVLPTDESAYYRQLAALFLVAAIEWPSDSVTTNSMSAMKALVINSDCLAIMPIQLVEIERRAGLVKCIKLIESGSSRSLGVSYSTFRRLTVEAQRFVALLRQLR